MFEAINVGICLGGRQILKPCHVKIEPGLFTAVVGPNGAGKTTLFKALAGELRPNKGEILVNGAALGSYRSQTLSMLRAILPQQSNVNFPFTVRQVVEIGRFAFKKNPHQNQTAIEEVMKKLDIKKFEDRTYTSLSGGEQKRVQLARVMAHIWDVAPYPKYLLLDEPTASLDIAQQHLLMAQAKSLCNRHIGVLAILHDLNLALQYADQILFLKDGQTVAYGDCQQVANRENIEKTFSHPVRIIEESGHTIVVPMPVQQPSAISFKKKVMS